MPKFRIIYHTVPRDEARKLEIVEDVEFPSALIATDYAAERLCLQTPLRIPRPNGDTLVVSPERIVAAEVVALAPSGDNRVEQMGGNRGKGVTADGH